MEGNRNVKEGVEYTGFEADVAEFNDLYMRKFMGLGIDEVVDSTINFELYISRKSSEDVLVTLSKKMAIHCRLEGFETILQNGGRIS